MSIINNGRHNAVRFTFANGYEVSAIWGAGSYSSSRDAEYNIGDIFNPKFTPSEDVEIAVFAPDGGFCTETFFPGNEDPVRGYIPVDELVDLLVRVRDYRKEASV